MKKLFHTASILLIIGTVAVTSGCILADFFGGELYYYTLIDPVNGIEEHRTLLYKSSGYTIIMSRGMDGEKLTRQEAEDLMDSTTFTLMLDGEEISGRDKGVDELGFMKSDGWHVVQYFDLPVLERGASAIMVGTSIFNGGGSITNTVHLKIR